MEFSVRLTDTLSVCYQPQLYNQCFVSTEPQSPRKRDRETKEKLKQFLRMKEESEKKSWFLSLSQSGAGVYRGQLGWREGRQGRQGVEVVQHFPVQRCPPWVPVEVVRAGAGGQQLPLEHHGVEGYRGHEGRHGRLAFQVLQARMLLESVLGSV